MRKPVSSWSVRGVGQEARALAAKAAGRQRMYLGEWLTHAITTTAKAELGDSPGTGAATGYRAAPAPANAFPEALERAAKELQAQLQEGRDAAQTLNALAERIDANPDFAANLATVARRIRTLDERDRKLLEFAERLVANDKKTDAHLDLMAQSLGMILNRMREMPVAPGSDEASSKQVSDHRLEMLADLIVRLKASHDDGRATSTAAETDDSLLPETDDSLDSEAMGAMNGESNVPPPIYTPNFEYRVEDSPKPGFWSRLFGGV